MVSLGLKPYDGNGVLELNPSLVFPILEMLLGGSGKTTINIQRDITEIEQKLLDGLLRIILQDLREAWRVVTAVDFTVAAMETEPQLLHILAPNEAVVAIAVEVRIGETVGMMNIAMPSIVIKMMRQKFDQQWSLRKTHASWRNRRESCASCATPRCRWRHACRAHISVHDLLDLEEGQLLTFDYPAGRPVDLEVNGGRKFSGYVVSTGKKRAFQIEAMHLAPYQGRTSGEESEAPAPPVGFGVKPAQKIEEGAAARPAVVAVQFQPLEKYEHAQQVRVAGPCHAERLVSCSRNSLTPSSTARKDLRRQAFSGTV
jgi:flagellar motor switch protein FliM